MSSNISSLIESRSRETTSLLSDLIKFPSTVGNEAGAVEYLADYARKLGFEAMIVPIRENIEADEDYTTVLGHQGYEGRSNLVCTLPGTGGGRSVILCSHLDVIPAPDEMFIPRIEGDTVYGRGAVDAKGQVLAIILALTALREAGIRLNGDVTALFVIEEEVGGNGALSAIADGVKADGVVIVEPTNLQVYPANRGAVWYKLEIEGKPTHMGRWRDGVNAVEEMIDVIRILKDWEKRLVADSQGDPLFPDPGANIKFNIGTIEGGSWPAMVAENCIIEGGIGFLPNKRLSDIRSEVRREIETNASEWTKSHYKLEFNRLHNEAYRTPPEHPLMQAFHRAVVANGGPSEVAGWTASCDARLFWHRGKIPTLCFGPGKFSYAHSADEQVTIPEINAGAKILVDFLVDWCGD